MDHLTELDRVMREEGRRGDWLARKVGYSEASVSLWRSGKRIPPQHVRQAVAQTLGRSDADADALFATPECMVTTGHDAAQEVPS